MEQGSGSSFWKTIKDLTGAKTADAPAAGEAPATTMEDFWKAIDPVIPSYDMLAKWGKLTAWPWQSPVLFAREYLQDKPTSQPAMTPPPPTVSMAPAPTPVDPYAALTPKRVDPIPPAPALPSVGAAVAPQPGEVPPSDYSPVLSALDKVKPVKPEDLNYWQRLARIAAAGIPAAVIAGNRGASPFMGLMAGVGGSLAGSVALDNAQRQQQIDYVTGLQNTQSAKAQALAQQISEGTRIKIANQQAKQETDLRNAVLDATSKGQTAEAQRLTATLGFERDKFNATQELMQNQFIPALMGKLLDGGKSGKDVKFMGGGGIEFNTEKLRGMSPAEQISVVAVDHAISGIGSPAEMRVWQNANRLAASLVNGVVSDPQAVDLFKGLFPGQEFGDTKKALADLRLRFGIPQTGYLSSLGTDSAKVVERVAGQIMRQQITQNPMLIKGE